MRSREYVPVTTGFDDPRGAEAQIESDIKHILGPQVVFHHTTLLNGSTYGSGLRVQHRGANLHKKAEDAERERRRIAQGHLEATYVGELKVAEVYRPWGSKEQPKTHGVDDHVYHPKQKG